MLKIGEFAALSGVSIHMLRNYDKIDLLKPERVDASSGYRYYEERQIIKANHIQVLKNMGFALKEIAALQENGMLDDTVKKLLRSKIKAKERELRKTQRQLRHMRQALEDLEGQKECALSINVKKLPPRKVVSLRGVLRDFPEESRLWQELSAVCQKRGVKLANTPYAFAITHSVNFKEKRIDTEVQLPVAELMPDFDHIRFYEIPAMEVVAVIYQGIYERINDIYNYASRWVKQNGYTICGKPFQTYYISPVNESNPENYITEIDYPVQIQKQP